MNDLLERKLLYREILLMSHSAYADETGATLFSESELKDLETEDLESLRRIRGRLRDLVRSLGGVKGRG